MEFRLLPRRSFQRSQVVWGEIQVFLAAWFMRRFLEYARSLNQCRAPVNNFFCVSLREISLDVGHPV
jgi:hypothetical protein